MVNTNKTQKYITRIGQYTGTSNTAENVMKKEIKVARVVDNQNCHSGRRRTNGRNSSSRVLGRGEGVSLSPPSSSSAIRSSWREGSNFGWEGKEQIEEVDGMRVANDIPALRIQDAQLKYRDRYSSSDPPRKNVRSDPVKSLLVLSF